MARLGSVAAVSDLAIDIRRALPPDADAVSRVNERAIRLSAGSKYSSAQIKAWASPVSVRCAAAMIQNTITFVGVVDGQVVAFASLVLPDGVIDQLYVDPDVGGRGLARALCRVVEAEAATHGLGEVTTTASLLAAPALARFGYTEVGRDVRAFNGESFPIVHMAKVLL
jgi:putative acetyltransferase